MMKKIQLTAVILGVLMLACPIFAIAEGTPSPEQKLKYGLFQMAISKDPTPWIEWFNNVNKYMPIDVNIDCSGKKDTPLQLATALHNVPVVALLVENGAVVDELSLLTAILEDYVDIVKIFVDHRADVFVSSKDGKKRVSSSLWARSEEMRELLGKAAKDQLAREKEEQEKQKEIVETSIEGIFD